MKKLLLVANVSKEHIRKFHIPFILKMKEVGWKVDVACRLDEPIPECNQSFNLPCDRNPFCGGILESIRILRKIIKENRYDIVHCNTVTGSIIARVAARPFRKEGVKVFYTNHGLHFFKGASLSRWLCGYPVEKYLAPWTDLLIMINNADYSMARKHLRACGAIERINGIGVNLARFRTCSMTEEQRVRYRKKIGLAADDFVLAYVAELNQNKNQQALVKVFKMVRELIPEAKLLLIGPDHDNGKLGEMVNMQGLADEILLLGWRSDIPELLNISDLYVASSKSEGLGINLIEAMACNIPVVALKNRGHCEIINDGRNGFLFEQDDYKGMAEAIIQIRQNPELRERLTKQAQIDICQYELEHVLEELSLIYEKYS